MVTCSVLLGVDKGDKWTKVVVGKEDWSWALRVANIGLLCNFNRGICTLSLQFLLPGETNLLEHLSQAAEHPRRVSGP